MSTTHDMLAQLISYYLNDDALVHLHLPHVMNVILTRSLLKDQKEESEETTTVRRKWTIRLNALMQSKQPTARWSAIVLIKLTCEQSPSLLFGHIRSWAGQLMGIVGKPATVVSHKAAIETLSYFFSYTRNKPELQREITIPSLPRFNQLILGLAKDEALLPVVLTALKSNIIHFPSQSRHIADQCTKLCLASLEGKVNTDKETIIAACQCLASLHHVTGKSSCSDQWKDTMLHLIGSVHGCLNRLFDTIDEELELSELPPSYPLPDVSPDPIEAFPILLRRIRSLNQAIITCLGSHTLTVVSVPVVQLIDLACRVYNVFEGSLFGYVFAESVCKPMVTSIMEDLHVTEQKVTDMAPTEVKNKSMKRKRDGLTNSDALANAGHSTQGPHDIQMSALDSLQDLLQCYGSAMDLHSRNTIDAKVISRLLSSAQNAVTSESELVVKEKLYQCLLASVMNPIEVQAAALPHAIRIFSAGVNEQNHKLQTICKQSLAICNLIIHPRMPPIQTTLNTITAKINQAVQSDSAASNANVPSTSYPATNSIITSTPATEVVDAQPLRQREDTPIADTAATQETVQLPESATDSSVVVENSTSKDTPDDTLDEINEKEDEEATATRQESVIEAITFEDPVMETVATTTTVKANIIRFDDIDNDTEPETAPTPDDAPQAVAKPPISSSNTITFDDLDDDDDLGEDALPDIDMAGPDTDEEEEDGF
ncbi:hypothetical protein [Absidia glauca]|uniref:Pre-rRNA-processing protein RIX1 n=1 Tax=Absidia glauca TaxID=4829 RepID=A0A168T6M1_ABSGL|nr:hypothetical protein [Absidia glauca]